MEWLNYHHLYYFWMVCKQGGYSKAATKLQVAQSSLSFQIAKLEVYFGEKLLVRGPQGIKLTEAGQVALAQAEEIFRQGNDLVQYFKSGQMKASFRIGALSGLSKNLQLNFLSSVIDDHAIELSIEAGDSAVLLERLCNYQLDAVLSDVPFPSSEAEPLVQKEFASEAMCLVTKPPSKRRKEADLSELLKKGVFMPAKSSPVTSALLDQLKVEAPEILIRGYIDDIAVLRLLSLESGALVAIPRIGVQRELEASTLSIVHEFKKIRQSYFLIYRQKGKRHPVLNALAKV